MPNDTEAPTSAATSLALAFDTLDDEKYLELQFVTMMRQYFAVHGMLMPEKVAVDEYQFETSEFQELLGRESVQKELTDKGILHRSVAVGKTKIKNLEWTKKDENLSPLQLMVANSMMDLVDQRSYKKKLNDFGVSTSTYQLWLSDPNFNNYMRTRAESMLGENHHEAILALLDKMRMGDTKAVELYLEMTGRYTRASASAFSNSNGQISDIQRIIVDIIEIINDEVESEIAVKISERIKGLINANQIASEIVESTAIEQPEIKPARTLTPQLKALLAEQGGEV